MTIFCVFTSFPLIRRKTYTLAVDDDIAVADEGEGLIVAVSVLADGREHYTEARGVVRCFGGEGVAWQSQQIHIFASHIVNQVEVAERHVLAAEAQCILAVFLGFEVEGHLALGFGIDYSVIHIVLWNIELRAVVPQLELGQLAAFAEVDDGAVDDSGLCGP